MILFVGQVARGAKGREAFQELDYRAVFGTMAKWVVDIDDPARLPELISRAFHVATSGRPGPVVVALPEDMLTEAASVADALPYLDDGMPLEVVFYEGKAISVNMPGSVVREVEYTEPAVKGDTSGKVMKPARIKPTNHTIQVPAFVEIGDKIEIDTATGEYRNRVK